MRAIAVRPESRLGDAAAWAAHEAMSAAERDGGTPADNARIVEVFIEAKRRLATEALALEGL